jgi:hypothetical protein
MLKENINKQLPDLVQNSVFIYAIFFVERTRLQESPGITHLCFHIMDVFLQVSAHWRMLKNTSFAVSHLFSCSANIVTFVCRSCAHFQGQFHQ